MTYWGYGPFDGDVPCDVADELVRMVGGTPGEFGDRWLRDLRVSEATLSFPLSEEQIFSWANNYLDSHREVVDRAAGMMVLAHFLIINNQRISRTVAELIVSQIRVERRRTRTGSSDWSSPTSRQRVLLLHDEMIRRCTALGRTGEPERLNVRCFKRPETAEWCATLWYSTGWYLFYGELQTTGTQGWQYTENRLTPGASFSVAARNITSNGYVEVF